MKARIHSVRQLTLKRCVVLCAIIYSGLSLAEPLTLTASWLDYSRHLPKHLSFAASNAYIATSDGLQIFDLSDPEHPESLSFTPLYETWEFPTDIHFLSESNRLAIGTGVSYGIHAEQVKGIDVSNLQNPQYVWAGLLHHRANQVYQHGAKVYSSHNLRGLSVSTWGVAGYGSIPPTISKAFGRVAVSGARLYVPSDTGFSIFQDYNEAWLGSFNAGAEGHALAVDDDDVYLAAADGLHVVDATAPAAMSETGFLPLPSGQYDPTDIRLTEDYACMIFSNTNLFMMVDRTIPASPTIAGTFEFPGPVRSIAVDEGFAYILAADQPYGSSDLRILDLSNPSNIPETNRLYAHGAANDLAIDGQHIFLADAGNGLCVFNMESSNLSLVGHHPGQFVSIAADSNRVYASSFGGISLYDVTSPEMPLSITNLSEPALYIEVGDNFVYWIGGYGMPELVVAEKNDQLTELHRLWWIDGISQVQAFDMVNDLYALIVEDSVGNMVVIDVQDSSMPILTNYYASAPIVDVAGQLDAVQTNALMATTNGLEVLDLSDSTLFSVTASWTAPSGQVPQNICADGERIALASSTHLWILDATQLNSGDPLIAETGVDHTISQISISGDLLYVAAGADGVMVYRIGEDTIQPTLYLTVESPTQIQLDWSDAGTGWQVQQKESLSVSNGWISLPDTESITTTNLDTALPCQFFRLKQ